MDAASIVVVSARMHERDKVAALDMGADDYITKPFGPSELLARIRTAIRHTRTRESSRDVAQSGKYLVGDMVIDYEKRQVLIGGANAHLTKTNIK